MDDALPYLSQFNLNYADMLLADVPEGRWCECVGGQPNHPAWIIGHLIYANDAAVKMLGHEPVCPENYAKWFGMGSECVDGSTDYPDKATLTKELHESSNALLKAYEQADDALLEQPFPDENMREIFPTIGKMIAFLMSSHAGVHLGQLSAWRRAAGLEKVL